ncbi:unnamed protein product [Oikopleura dioica]|uniref:Uncharacterized protein n=1 Tax=Oikopleura dioica TaxID=34765 RepID=E4WSL8_OIKDI|nr:unnamed protein product [Oikopleura dioica]
MQHSQKLKEELKVIIQTLKVSLRQVQTFRTTVDDVFQFLSNGYADDGSDTVESHQLRFQQKFIKDLERVLTEFEEFKSICLSLPNNIPNTTPPLSNLAQLAQDPDPTKAALFHQLQHNHVWWERLQSMSADQHSYLARNNMKRSSYPKSHPQSKIQRPANKGYHNNPEFINVVMQQVIKVFVPDLKMNISPISGSSRVLQVQNRPAKLKMQENEIYE